MFDAMEALAALSRPKLLLDAARHGLASYRRERDLARLLRANAPPARSRAVARLMDEEGRLEEIRQSGAGTYSARRHVAVMTALLAEAQEAMGFDMQARHAAQPLGMRASYQGAMRLTHAARSAAPQGHQSYTKLQ